MFKKLFQSLKGGSSEKTGSTVAADPVTYKDVTIIATPISEGGQFKTAGTITRMVDGVEQKTEFIRADNHSSADAAVDHAINKAKLIVDERGSSLFNSCLLYTSDAADE